MVLPERESDIFMFVPFYYLLPSSLVEINHPGSDRER